MTWLYRENDHTLGLLTQFAKKEHILLRSDFPYCAHTYDPDSHKQPGFLRIESGAEVANRPRKWR